MHLSTSSLLSFVTVASSLLAIHASPIRSHNDGVDAVARSMLGPNSNAVSWDSLPLERSPSDPDMDLQKRIVYNPPITYPTNETVWTAGKKVTVKWTVKQSDIPANAKDYVASLKLGYLVKGGDGNEHLHWTLADNFPITDESVTFKLPSDLATRKDYIVVLLGDSGNKSKKFTINSLLDSTAKGTKKEPISEKKKTEEKKVEKERDVVEKAHGSLLGLDLA